KYLDSDTYQYWDGRTVSAITKGKFQPISISAIAGTINIGDYRNLYGHDLAQSNWYAYGCMSGDTNAFSQQITEEFFKLSFSNYSEFVSKVGQMMLDLFEVIVNYEESFGLHHGCANDHYYGPGPSDVLARPDWIPTYYFKAAADGIGFDRIETGSNTVPQYNELLNSMYANLETCPEYMLLWFHHLPWDYKIKNGETMLDALCHKYQESINTFRCFIGTLDSVKQYVGNNLCNNVRKKLVRQAKDLILCRKALMLYFQTFSNLPFPSDACETQRSLEWLESYKLWITNYEARRLRPA
ncbi:MAG: alpha-glucuronidase, partial [Eggerthellaceae bacterium]|nr:alpha-glucuronidase [Eggerthellaceae bacterium]